jgi:hypothetical protein
MVQDLLNPSISLGNTVARIGDPIQTLAGERASNYHDLHSNWQGQDVMVGLISNTAGCPACSPPLAGFRWFHVYSADGGGDPKTIVGWWVDPRLKPPAMGTLLGNSGTLSGPTTFALVR